RRFCAALMCSVAARDNLVLARCLTDARQVIHAASQQEFPRLGAVDVRGLGCPAMAQRLPPPPQLLTQDPQENPLPCEAFTLNADDDWVAKRDITMPGPNGQVRLKAGTVVDDELQ